ncbi:MAG: dTDP-glucose 4,6-dehydratase [Dehalococcoidia bacterium]
MRKILVTGGMGFIGSNLIRLLLQEHADIELVNIDKLTYAGNPLNLADVASDPDLGTRHRFVQGDICDPSLVRELMAGCWGVAHLAAESHVDRSISGWRQFLETEVAGTATLLEAARDAGVQRFLHVSTDEVYGDIPAGKRSVETDPLRPRSPYAAAKASAEQFCLAFNTTYNVPVVISRASNNVGPYQHPEKAVPLFTTNALLDQPLPIYGDGLQVRDWIYVIDPCRALDLLLHQGISGEIYNVGAGNEATNLEVVEGILRLLNKPRSYIRHISDRQGHDRRYALDSSKVEQLGWSRRENFESALSKTVAWYRENQWWWGRVRNADYDTYYEGLYGARIAASENIPGSA